MLGPLRNPNKIFKWITAKIRSMRTKRGITTSQALISVVVIVILAAAGLYVGLSVSVKPSTLTVTQTSTSVTTATTVSTVSSTTTSSTTTPHVTPSTFTYEAAETIQSLDPSVSFFSYDYNIMQNVYEPLLWFNGTSGTSVIPWLAKGYTQSADLKTYNFTLRSGVVFADGEPVNSTSVYFALNRILVEDGSTPTGHGTQASFLLWGLVNSSLSSTLCSCSQTYNKNYVDAVLAQNFVQVTGPLTFTIHVKNPSVAFAFILAGDMNSVPLPPNYVMQQDLALWKVSSTGYKLPYPTLSGSTTTQIRQYFYDEAATCDTGITPSGCGTTYLDGSANGAKAGTGPYVIQSVNPTTNTIVITANPNYWGGPYQFLGGQKITPKIQTVVFKFVPDQTTREIDLQNAAKSGLALAIDVEAPNLYDVADRGAWLKQSKLVSVLQGVSIFGPFTTYNVQFIHWVTNVTNPLTGNFYKFQPFADRRLRLAFSDAVNMTLMNAQFGNNLGVVANTAIPPGLPPVGTYNPSLKPAYSFNPGEVQRLLLDAMQHPLSTFHFLNGTLARKGLFDNTFGCATLSSSGTCSNPVPQTIQLYVPTGDTFDEQIFTQIAGVINNASGTYNMGLQAQVVPLPSGQLLSDLGHLYSYEFGWIDDYPWVLDFLSPMYAPSGTYTGPDGWNIPLEGTLINKAVTASAAGNLTGLVSISNQMSQIANNAVIDLWTNYPYTFIVMTSNVQGFFWNPSLSTAAAGGVGPEYFATLY